MAHLWLAIISLIGILICLIVRLWGKDEHDVITAEEVRKPRAEFVEEV